MCSSEENSDTSSIAKLDDGQLDTTMFERNIVKSGESFYHELSRS